MTVVDRTAVLIRGREFQLLDFPCALALAAVLPVILDSSEVTRQARWCAGLGCIRLSLHLVQCPNTQLIPHHSRKVTVVMVRIASTLLIARKLFDPDVVAVHSHIQEHRMHGFDHGRRSRDVVHGRSHSLEIFCKHLRVDHTPFS